MSGAVQVTSSSVVGADAPAETDGAAGASGGSSASVTVIVTGTVCEPGETETDTLYDALDSWSSAVPDPTLICPVPASIANIDASVPLSVCVSPEPEPAVTGAPTAVPAGEFSATEREALAADGAAVAESDHGLVPSSFVAFTRTSYVVPDVRPLMVVLVPVPVKECEIQFESPTLR